MKNVISPEAILSNLLARDQCGGIKTSVSVKDIWSEALRSSCETKSAGREIRVLQRPYFEPGEMLRRSH